MLNVGSVSTAGTFTLGSDTDSGASPGTATAMFTVNGGTANVFGNTKNTGTKGTTTSTLNLNAGTLNLEGNSIGGAVANSGNGPITVNFPGGGESAAF